MEVTTVNYLNLGFSWFMVLMSIWGYISIVRNTRQRWGFWIWFGLAWMLLGVSHILTVVGISPTEGYFIAIRACGYALMVISVLSLMLRFVEEDDY